MSQRSIAETRHMSRSSVGDVFAFASEKGLSYSDVAGKSNAELYDLFFPYKFPTEKVYGGIDYENVDAELKRPGVTLKLLWIGCNVNMLEFFCALPVTKFEFSQWTYGRKVHPDSHVVFEKKPVGYVRGAEYYSNILAGNRHPTSDGGEKNDLG